MILTTTLPPDLGEPQIISHKVFLRNVKLTGKISTDQTGRFPMTSIRGNNNIMLLFDHDRNAILVEPLKSCSAQELGRAYKVLHAHLCDRGLRPLFQMLDNEYPISLKQFMH